MNIGVLNESPKIENRVGLNPGGVSFLREREFNVYVQAGAGLRAGYSNEEFASQGAEIVFTPEEVFGRADLVLNISPLSDEECSLVREGQILMGFHHLAVAKKANLEKLLKKKVSILGYEIFQEKNGALPFIESLGEIAGQMCLSISGHYLQTIQGGRGLLLGGVVSVPPATAVVIGSGVLARSAVKALIGAGAHTIVLGTEMENLRGLEEMTSGRVITLVGNKFNLSRIVKIADILIGAVLEPGAKAPQIISKDMVKTMRRGSLIIDLAIDQGGCIETSRLTTLDQPTFLDEGVIHYCVPNITSAVSRTSTKVLSNLAAPFIDKIGDPDLEKAIEDNETISSGLYVCKGRIVNKIIAERFRLPYTDISSISKK